MSFEFFAQAVGFLAFTIGVCGYQFKDQKKLFTTWVIADSIWTIHYILIAATTPALAVSIAAVRTLLVVFVFPQYKTQLIALAMACITLLCLLGEDGHIGSYLPILSALCYSLATYYNESYYKSRFFAGTGKIIWIAIGVYFVSYAEITASLVGLTSILIGVYRHQFHKASPQ